MGAHMKKRIDGTKVIFSFDDGKADYVFDSALVTDAIKAMAVPMAFSHRLGDNAALARKDKNGNVVTITEEMRREAVTELGDYYLNGATAWNMRAAATRALNPTWVKLAEKRGVSYDVIAAEKAAADLAELQSME